MSFAFRSRSGRPIIAGEHGPHLAIYVMSLRTVPVQEGDAWAFFASHELHATAQIQGSQPRIVFGFGWPCSQIHFRSL